MNELLLKLNNLENYTEGKKSNPNGYILYNLIFISFWNGKLLELEGSFIVAIV